MKIVFTGAECAGKSFFSDWASIKFQIPLVNEQSRAYLAKIKLAYQKRDVRSIGLLQIHAEKELLTFNDNIVCDTDILTILIWQLEKYGHFDDDFFKIWKNDKVTQYILCAPDIPWVNDPLRENPHDRDRLHVIYRDMLEEYGKNYIILKGTESEKITAINNFIKSLNLG